MSRPRVAVVFGGRSTEHAVSCISAGSVLAALDRDRYDVVAVGITPDGRWMITSDDPRAYAITDGNLPAVPEAGDPAPVPADPTALPVALGRIDVVFPLLHGPYGEDGTIQGLFELAGIPYVGSGVLASALAMDKEFMKVVLAARGLPVPDYVVVRRGASADVGERIGYPCFVKPARGGSSVGTSRVASADALPQALAAAHEHDPKALVESAINGRELECGVLQTADGRVRASVPAEIHVSGREFYDFQAKYLDDTTRFDVPAQLPPGVTERVQQMAVDAFRALGCEGLARVDFFLIDDSALVVNEVNTMPGFTPVSMYPRMWAASGVDYSSLVETLLAEATSRPTGLR